MNRKMRRAMKNAPGDKATDKLGSKVALFDKLPEQCLTCHKEFDKKDREMVNSWSVVVKQNIVRLFCPECIKQTQEVIDGSNKNK